MLRHATSLATAARGGRHLLGYLSGTILLALTSLLAIPALISADGLENWSGFALGQAAGSIAAATINLGLRVSGPSEVAATRDPERRGLLVQSIRVRLVVVLPVVAIATLVAALIAPGLLLFVLLGVVQQASNGLSDRWYLVGMSRPFTVFMTDALPRTLANILAVLAVYLLGAGLAEAAILMCVGTIASSAMTSVASLGLTSGVKPQIPKLGAFVRGQMAGLWVNLTESGLLAAPMLLIGILAPGALAQYAFYDKVYRQGTSGLTPISQVLQPWSARRTGAARWRRITISIGIGFVVVLMSAALGATIGVPILRLLAAGEVDPGWSTTTLLATAVGLWVMRMIAVRSGLMPLRDSRFVGISSTVGLAISLLLTVGGAYAYGSDGAVAGIAVGAVLQCAVLCARLEILRRRQAPFRGEGSPADTAGAGEI